MSRTHELATIAADAAMRGAVAYLDAHDQRATVDVGRLLAALRSECSASIGPALDDARAAHDAGMDGCATATFLASMRLAGIRAAQTATR